MADKKIRVGVIGTGFGTIVHIPAFQSCADTEMVAVCSAREERARETAAKFDIPNWSTDYKAMVARDDIDLVSISTPPFEHYPMAMAALDAGKHVLLEKPMALNAQQCREMLQRAQEQQVVHMIAHEFRWAPARAYMAKLISEGYIGQLRHVNISLFLVGRMGSLASPLYTWSAQRKMGGGMLMALGSHFIDGLRQSCGDFSAVAGLVATHVPERRRPEDDSIVLGDADDAFTATFRFKSGGWGAIAASLAAPFGSGGRFEVYGTEGTLSAPQPGANPLPDGRLYSAKRGEKELQEIPIPREYHPFDDERDQRLLAFRLMVDEMVTAIRGGKPAPPTFEDGLRVQEAIDGIYKSSDTGVWVELP